MIVKTKDKIDYQQEAITNRVRGLMTERNVMQKDLANFVMMSPVAISKQFQTGKISTRVMIGALMLSNADPDDFVRILKLKGDDDE